MSVLVYFPHCGSFLSKYIPERHSRGLSCFCLFAFVFNGPPVWRKGSMSTMTCKYQLPRACGRSFIPCPVVRLDLVEAAVGSLVWQKCAGS